MAEPLRTSILAIAPDEASARQLARTEAYGRGWIGTRITALEQMSGPPMADRNGRPQLRYRVTIEAAASRVTAASKSLAWAADHDQYKSGTRVRTSCEGQNWAGGRRRSMPAGAVGLVVGRIDRGPNLRVRFESEPRRTFVYSPDALEVVS